MPSLCTLAQRMGRGARKLGTTATAIYLVEPKYFDDHKKKATSKIGKRKRGRVSKEQSSRKKAKTTQLAVNQKDPATESESDGDNSDDEIDIDGVDRMDVDDGSPATTNAGKEVPRDTTSTVTVTAPLIPSPAGMAKDEYEFQVMDIYINAKGRKICRRKVCDEYFGNDKGQGFVIRDSDSH